MALVPDTVITTYDGVRAQIGAATMGEAAEIICEWHTGGLRVKRGRRDEDIVTTDRRHYQVKSRTYRPNGRKLEFKKFNWDALYFLMFSPDRLRIVEGKIIPVEYVKAWPKKKWNTTNHSWDIHLTREFLEMPAAVDITAEVQSYDVRQAYTQALSELRAEQSR